MCAAMVLKKYRAMHNYNKVEKEIIDLLRDQDVRYIKLLGNTIQKAFFRAEKTAMLVDCANPKLSCSTLYESHTITRTERDLHS